MVAFPKYENYKDTSISWIQNIPTTWKIERAKWLFQKMERPIRPEDDVVTAFRDGEVTLRKNRREEGFTNAIQEHGYQGIRSGDLVISAMDAFAGAIGVSDSDGKSTPVYSVCIPSGEFYVNNYYYAYLIRYMAKSGFILSLSKGIRERSTDFRFNDFANLYLPIPSKEEQDKIVEFLDRKTAEIDQAIKQKYRLIKLLKEQKAILIDRAITKGLNPNVPMRDSGIESVGLIPEYWKVSKIGHYARVSNGSTPRRELSRYWQNGNISWLSSGKVNDFTITEPSELITKQALNECSLRLYSKGTVVIGMIGQGKTRGTTAILEIEACINQNMAAIEPRQNLNNEFLHRYLIKAYQEIRDYGRGANQEALNCDLVRSFKIVIPPIYEQLEIMKYLKNIELEVAQLIKAVSKEVECLTEYKSILVCDTVTGK